MLEKNACTCSTRWFWFYPAPVATPTLHAIHAVFSQLSAFQLLISKSDKLFAERWSLVPVTPKTPRHPVMICVTSGLDEISPVHTGYPWRALPHTHNFSFMRHKITTRCVFICALPSLGLICFHIQYSYYSLFSTALLQESKWFICNKCGMGCCDHLIMWPFVYFHLYLPFFFLQFSESLKNSYTWIEVW